MKKIQICDLFCGAGGTSTGALEAIKALGYEASLTAINHWDVAINTHKKNHPDARHLCTAIDDVNPRHLFKYGELDILLASPECINHSQARGNKPINDQSRATAWCVARWAEAIRPSIILVENVPSFRNWGPLDSNSRPIKSRKGQIFHSWFNTFEAIGYQHADYRNLCAADYGDPTSRERFFMQAVYGRRKIVWPNPTHSETGEPDMFSNTQTWEAAEAVIDWSMPGHSIFKRKKPLSEKTMTRIREGFKIHGLNPFIIELRGTNPQQLANSARSLQKPLGAITTSGTHHALIRPYLIHTAHRGKRQALPINKPHPTVCGNRRDTTLCQPFLLPQQSCGVLRPISMPAPTISTAGAVALIQPRLIPSKNKKSNPGISITIDGQHHDIDILYRLLQTHELAAIQGFHPNYMFTGNKTQQVKQIGNAVPRRLARAIVLAALSQEPDIGKYLQEKKSPARTPTPRSIATKPSP
jgi:DNA (cytosine-5)-methyltransferase 1